MKKITVEGRFKSTMTFDKAPVHQAYGVSESASDDELRIAVLKCLDESNEELDTWLENPKMLVSNLVVRVETTK